MNMLSECTAVRLSFADGKEANIRDWIPLPLDSRVGILAVIAVTWKRDFDPRYSNSFATEMGEKSGGEEQT